jgi:hypothetical protein
VTPPGRRSRGLAKGGGHEERPPVPLNGRPTEIEVDGSRMLLWVLRGELGLTGAKYGCGEGLCGACTVLVDGEAVPLVRDAGRGGGGQARGHHRGARRGRAAPPAAGGVRRARRLPVRLLHAGDDARRHALLAHHPRATRQQIVDGLEGNLCRCGAHQRIVAAVEQVAAGKGGARERVRDRPWRASSSSIRGVDFGSACGIDRRSFLRLVGGGIAVFVTLGPEELFAQRRPYPEDLNAYLLIGADGGSASSPARSRWGRA